MKKAGESAQREGSSAVRFGLRLFVGIAVFGLCIVAFQVLKSNRPQPAQVQDRSDSRLVETMPARIESVQRSFQGYGTTRAERSATVAAQVTAQVVERPESAKVGKWVRQGEVLVRLEADVFREREQSASSSVSALEADLDSLDVELESAQERLELSDLSIELIDNEITDLVSAVERGGARQIEVDRLRRQKNTLELERETIRQVLDGIPSRRAALQARIAAQQAELSLARIDLERASVVAPITGFIAEFYVDTGDAVSPGESVARIVDLRLMEVPLRVNASASTQLRQGDRASVRVSSGSRTYEGTVKRIAPEIDPNSRTITVYVEIQQTVDTSAPMNPADLLLPGQFVSGEVVSESSLQAILVPRVAVRADRVMVIDPDSGTAQPRTARVEFYSERQPESGESRSQWAVLSAEPSRLPDWMPPLLREGELIITSNLDGLPTGTPVRSLSESDLSP